MSKCRICGECSEAWAWQPFGPADNFDESEAFMFPGNHYRGFPVLKICDECREAIMSGHDVEFSYKQMDFATQGSEIVCLQKLKGDAI